MSIPVIALLLGLTLCASACGPAAGDSPDFRSPSHDYPGPARTTADGEPIGADRRPVTDTIDASGPAPARAPEESPK